MINFDLLIISGFKDLVASFSTNERQIYKRVIFFKSEGKLYFQRSKRADILEIMTYLMSCLLSVLSEIGRKQLVSLTVQLSVLPS